MTTIRQRLKNDEGKIRKYVEQKMSCKSISKIYKCSSATIWKFLKENNIQCAFERDKNYGKIKKHKDEIINRFKSEESIYNISKSFDFSYEGITQALKHWGMNTSKGKRVRTATLPIKEYTDKIIQYYQEGMSIQEVSEKVGFSCTGVRKVLENNNIPRRQSIPTYTVNEDFFENIDSESKAYILGWLYSDGNVCGNAFKIEIVQDDGYIIKWIKDTIGYSGNLSYRKKENKNHRDSISLCVNRKKMANDLKRHGCIPAKSFYLQFPIWLDNSLIRHFVRGLFEGDGCIHKHQIIFYGAYNLLNQMIEYLPCEISGLYQKDKNRKKLDSIHTLGIYRKKEASKICKWMYNDITTIVLQRKYDKICDAGLLE